MDEWKYYRNYEVAVYTLQDNYITTLKSGDPILVASQSAVEWPQTRMRGQIQNGQMELNIDGTQSFTFDIPMYLYVDGKRIENPNWYDVINKNILTSMRKVKVIFNKWQNIGNVEAMSNSTFEFLIVKVQETHESDNLICHVECEGLAFHELGKVGYKCSLTVDEFEEEYNAWAVATEAERLEHNLTEPFNNLQYWMSKTHIDFVPKKIINDKKIIDYDAMNPNKWYYDIQMAHTGLVHNLENILDDKIYEEGYPIDWTSSGTPSNYMEVREMARLVTINESNLYNITQDLAETFNVFCRYEYIYDNNYNIVGRLIVFYNNFLQEGKDVISLMYPHSASKIMREMDSTDVSTKMFVRSVDNADVYHGIINIMDCEANKSREDYLMNFDYLHDTNIITNEQYDEIGPYEVKMREWNDKIVPLQDASTHLAKLKTDIDAQVKILTKSIELDEERITETTALMNALDQADGDTDGYITLDWRNPDTLALIKDSSQAEYDTYTVKFNSNGKCGIDADSLHLYKAYATTSTHNFTYYVSFYARTELNAFELAGQIVSDIPHDNGSAGPFTYSLNYKGTKGSSDADIKKLPTASSSNKGWIYKDLDSNGDIWYSNGSSWTKVTKPSGIKEKAGFYIYTVEQLKQINGAVSEQYKCTRKGASGAVSTPYFTSWQRLYYTTNSSNEPSIPTIETATSDATTIVKDNQLDKWSSYLSTPEVIGENTKFYSVWRTRNSASETKFSGMGLITSDASGSEIADQAAAARDHFLKPEDEITGYPYFDPDTGMLAEVRGLFQSPKSGNYYSYGETKQGVSLPGDLSATNSIINNFILPNTKLTASPLNQKQSYVMIHEQYISSNGNTVNSYRLKYYTVDSIVGLPEDRTLVSSIKPIFYLSTSGNAPSAAPTTENVKSTKQNDVWTYILPDKTKKAWKYYSGWAITQYNDNIVFYYSTTEDTSLKMAKNNSEDEEVSTIPSYIYATYRYSPDLYYKQIQETWSQKLYNDNQDLAELNDKKNRIDTLQEQIKDTLEDLLKAKQNDIAKFEHMMGAALRESYWQPDDEYQDYGKKYNEKLNLLNTGLYNNHGATYFNNKTAKHFSSIGWDSIVFTEEDKLYFEHKVTKEKVYYPCIDLTKLLTNKAGNSSPFLTLYHNWAIVETGINPFSFFFNPRLNTIPASDDAQGVRYLKYYTIGANSKLAFIRHGINVIPVLVLMDAHNLADTELTNLRSTGHIGQLIPTTVDNNVVLKYNDSTAFSVTANSAWISENTLKSCEIVYPRIVIPSLKLKNNSKDLVVKYKDAVLKEYADYYTLTKSYYTVTSSNYSYANSDNEVISYKRVQYKDLDTITSEDLSVETNFATLYTITLKPETLFKYVNTSTFADACFDTYFAISNADIDIYLDAQKILKENAYPKVAYEIDVSIWYHNLFDSIYNKLAQLVMINDTDLKLQNTFGYISSVKLDLDHEEKDTIEVKNYKTKFEDLFSRIVAETESMHKNSRNIGLAGVLASGDSVDVTLDSDGFSSTLGNATNQQILQDFLSEYFDGPEVVQQMLQGIWNEAGAILASAATSLNSVMNLTTENATILSGFRENVAAALTPKVFTGDVAPTVFKPGDIWINDEKGYRAVATGYNGTGGFTRTYDGRLAEIHGASMDIDTVTGTVDILAETKINLMSGGNVYIAAGDTVDIVGNKSVNIGGTTINMASSNIIGGGYNGQPGKGGLHLVATEYQYDSSSEDYIEGSISRVDIHGEGIELASKNGIILKSGAGIDIKSADSENVSAIQIDKDKGVYIGASNALKLYAGTPAAYFYGPFHGAKFHKGDYWEKTAQIDDYTNLDSDKNQLSSDENYYLSRKVQVQTHYIATKDWEEVYSSLDGAKAGVNTLDGWQDNGSTPAIIGASVELTPDHLSLGMASTNQSGGSATAIDLSTEQIIIAAGDELSQLKFDEEGKIADITGANLTGIQIQKNYIGMAVGASDNTERSLFSMTPYKAILGIVARNTDYEFLDKGTTWTSTGKSQDTIYLEPEKGEYEEYYTKHWYNTEKSKWVAQTHVGPEAYEGSYLWLDKNEIYIGSANNSNSTGHFTVNTNNIKIQTKLLETPTVNTAINYADAPGANDPVDDPKEYASTMGFCLGKNLNASNKDDRKPYFGFWIDKKDSAHFVIDADVIRLGHDGVVDDVALSGKMPVEVKRLYRLYNSNTTEPASNYANGKTWGDLVTTDLTTVQYSGSNDFIWTEGLPSPENRDNCATNDHTKYQYVWSTMQSRYECTGTINGESAVISKYRATTPQYEGLIDNLTQTSYLQYKYFSSIVSGAAAISNALSESDEGWTIEMPPCPEYTTDYYYLDDTDSNNKCNRQTDITQSITLSGGSNKDIRYVTSSTYIDETDNTTKDIVVTIGSTQYKVKKGDWFIKWTSNGTTKWQKAEKIIRRNRASYYLHSRVHVIENNGIAYNKDLKYEEELGTLSASARQAWNIANGTYAVPAVSSSGLLVEGDQVVLGSTGKLMLLGNAEVFVGTNSSNSALVLDKKGISIGSGGEIAVASSKGIWIGTIDSENNRTNSIKLTPDGMTLYADKTLTLSGATLSINATSTMSIISGATIEINSTNFEVHSTATNGNTIFKVGDTDHYVKYTSNGLTIKGNIDADTLTIGGETAEDFVNAKVTPEQIWLGVRAATNPSDENYQQSSIQILNDAIIISSYTNSSNTTTKGRIEIESTGIFKVNTSNVVINTELPASGGTIFQLRSASSNGDDYMKISKDSSGNITAKISGWDIASDKFSCSSGKVYLASSGTYAINVNDNFMVDFDGKVWLKKLIVDGQEVNFTTAFKKAVSFRGQWNSDNEFEVFAKFYNNNSLEASKKMKASVTVRSGAVYAGDVDGSGGCMSSGLILLNLGIGDDAEHEIGVDFVEKKINTSSVYQQGFGAAAKKCKKPKNNSGVATCVMKIPKIGTAGPDVSPYGDDDVVFSLSVDDTPSASGKVYIKCDGVTVAEKNIGDWYTAGHDDGVGSINIRNSRSITVPNDGQSHTYGPGTGYDAMKQVVVTVGTDSGGSGCFAAGSLVTLVDGTQVPIEKLGLDMKILAYDEINKRFVPSDIEVLQVIKNRTLRVLELQLSSNRNIIVTAEHPFLTEFGWSAVDTENAIKVYGVGERMLQVGDKLISSEKDVYVKKIIEHPELSNITVYHMDVEPYDTYVVDGVVVHNDEVAAPK